MAVEFSIPYVPIYIYRPVHVSTEQRSTSEYKIIIILIPSPSTHTHTHTHTHSHSHTHTHTHTHSAFRQFAMLCDSYIPGEGEQRHSIIENGHINSEVALPFPHIIDNLPQLKVRHHTV